MKLSDKLKIIEEKLSALSWETTGAIEEQLSALSWDVKAATREAEELEKEKPCDTQS